MKAKSLGNLLYEPEPVIGNGLTLVQTMESYCWSNGLGSYINTVSNKDTKIDHATFNCNFGITMADPIELGKHVYTYETVGELEYMHGRQEEELCESNVENFLKLKDDMRIVMDSSDIRLGGYSLMQSDRIVSFGLIDEPNASKRSIRAVLHSYEKNDYVSLVYTERPAQKNGEERLFLAYNKGLYPLDLEKNRDLVLMMQTINFIHENMLKETSVQVIDYTETARV